MRFFTAIITGLLISLLVSPGYTKDKRQHVKYEPAYKDSVLKKIREKNDQKQKEMDTQTKAIREKQKEQRKKEREERKVIRVDFTDIDIPETPDEFQSAYYFPPVRQYMTGTCWSFSTTSFFESEIYRLTGRKIKLSEMYTPYFEYIEKARGYVRTRGESFFGQGSQANAVTKIWKKYGIVPLEVYDGVLDEEGLHDHSQMFAEMKAYLQFVKENDLWDEELVVQSIRLIMDRYMGRPPEVFSYNGKKYTPQSFLAELGLNLDDYVCLMSTLRYPFYEFAEYKVPDNWWHNKEYFNIPLKEFYQICRTAVKEGYTLTIGGDVSEPGLNGFADAAVIPTYDIPGKYIDQDSREFRIYNGTTTDDHGIHLVGYEKRGGDEWFLIKDSSSRAYHGKHPGYFFFRDDFIKLKMRTIMVHKDIVKQVVKEFPVN